MTYKYCKFVSWPSSETSSPDKSAFPRSLCVCVWQTPKQRFICKSRKWNKRIKYQIFIKEVWWAYTRVTLFLGSHVTWNQVHGVGRAESQLCKTFFGSYNFDFRLFNASTVLHIWILIMVSSLKHQINEDLTYEYKTSWIKETIKNHEKKNIPSAFP